MGGISRSNAQGRQRRKEPVMKKTMSLLIALAVFTPVAVATLYQAALIVA
jgi:hypothetical protein